MKPTTCLPQSGLLSFFYEPNREAKWFDPADQNALEVYYFADTGQLARTRSPEHPRFEFVYLPCALEFSVERSFPHPFSKVLDDLGLSVAEQEDNYWQLSEEVQPPKPDHQLFGYPYLYQSDIMDVDCQLLSHNFYLGRADILSDPSYADLRRGAKDWRFLLQIDTDRNAGLYWGISAGSLYFWIRKNALEQQDFDSVVWVQQFI